MVQLAAVWKFQSLQMVFRTEKVRILYNSMKFMTLSQKEKQNKKLDRIFGFKSLNSFEFSDRKTCFMSKKLFFDFILIYFAHFVICKMLDYFVECFEFVKITRFFPNLTEDILFICLIFFSIFWLQFFFDSIQNVEIGSGWEEEQVETGTGTGSDGIQHRNPIQTQVHSRLF